MLRPPLPVEDPGPESNAIFIHDFASVPLGWNDASERFASMLSAPVLTDLVLEAWNAEAESAADKGLDVQRCAGAELVVRVGQARRRTDAVVIPISWTGAGVWVSPLDADVEIAGFGPDRLHIHLLGRSRLPADVVPCTAAASLHQRLSVAVVRHVLARLVDHVSRPTGSQPR